MTDFHVIAVDDTVPTEPQLVVPQPGDTYKMEKDFALTGNFTLTGTINGYDLGDMLVDSDAASQGEAEAGTENTKFMTPLRVAQAIAVLAAGLTNKLDGTTAPTNTNDETEGYSAGSFWVDQAADQAYRCVDPTTNVAVWVKTTLQTSDLASVAISGDSDDLVEGSTKLLLTAAERTKLGYMTISQAVDLDVVEADLANVQSAVVDLTSVAAGVAAYAGGGQANATELTARYNEVTTVASINDSVKLPTAAAGLRVVVFNRGGNTLAVFPGSGDSIDATGVDAAVTITSLDKAVYVSIDGTNWYSE